ncbi:MAG: hypothetical protein AB4050_19630 [Synechococcus sp.]
MAISKNFLALAALTLFVTSMMALHPLAPDSSESASESFVHRPTTPHYN